MANEAKDVRREAHTKIRTKIVTALEKEFGLEQTPGLQIEFGNHTDTWLSLPTGFSKSELSDKRIVAALEKEFGIAFNQGSYVRFGDDQQGADIWLSIPSEFLKGELSDEERKAVAGRSIMIRWDILKGKFLPEAKPGELMLIGFGIFPAKFLS